MLGVVALGLVVVVVVAALACEHWLRSHGVQRAADRIAMALDADVELQVVGRPLLWHATTRELPGVTVVADDLPVLQGRATLDRLEVELDTVRLDGRDHQVTAEAGRFHLTLGNDQLLRMVTLPSYLVTFEVVPEGLRLQTLAGVVVDATVRLDRDGLVVRPASSMLRLLPQPVFRLPLPAWPFGARVEGMKLHTGSLEAWGTMAPQELHFPTDVPWRRRTTYPS